MKNYVAELKGEAGRIFLIANADTKNDARLHIEDYMRDHKDLQTIKSINRLKYLPKKYQGILIIN